MIVTELVILAVGGRCLAVLAAIALVRSAGLADHLNPLRTGGVLRRVLLLRRGL
jgi:hypothetical protein